MLVNHLIAFWTFIIFNNWDVIGILRDYLHQIVVLMKIVIRGYGSKLVTGEKIYNKVRIWIDLFINM